MHHPRGRITTPSFVGSVLGSFNDCRPDREKLETRKPPPPQPQPQQHNSLRHTVSKYSRKWRDILCICVRSIHHFHPSTNFLLVIVVNITIRWWLLKSIAHCAWAPLVLQTSTKNNKHTLWHAADALYNTSGARKKESGVCIYHMLNQSQRRHVGRRRKVLYNRAHWQSLLSSCNVVLRLVYVLYSDGPVIKPYSIQSNVM